MNIVLGIDYGTSNTVISYYDGNKYNIIPNENGNYISPSVVFLSKDTNEILYGDNCMYLLNSSNNESYLSNIFKNLKRLIGKTKRDFYDPTLKETFKYNLNNTSENGCEELSFDIQYNNKMCNFTVSSLITLYLNYIKQLAIDKFGENDFSAVITVPVYFNDSQRIILKSCFENVGFTVIRIINEAVSASLAYTCLVPESKESEHILIFDTGAGTSDLTLLNMDYTNKIYQVENSIGNNNLGGQDINNAISDFIKTKLIFDDYSQKILNKINIASEKAKKELSFKDNTNIYIEINNQEYNIPFSINQFLEILKPFCKKIKDLVYFLIDEMISKDPLFNYSKVSKVIFIGGTSRIPYFITLFKQIFGEHIFINNTINPDHTVSIGACIQGMLLSDDNNLQDILLLDAVTLSLGVEIDNGIMSPVISRNTILPVSRTRTFTNDTSFDNIIIINVYQGERRFVKDNFFLGSFKLESKEFTKHEKGELLIQVTFTINADNLISITAICKLKYSENPEVNKIKITKDITFDKSDLPKNINDILLDSENNKLLDNELADKLLKKMELYDSFKFLLSTFQEKRSIIVEKFGEKCFLMYELNKLFNNTFDIINNYTNYTSIELKKFKTEFEENWHTLLFSVCILKNEFGQLIQMNGTEITET
jgi:molecular chaperone DnaK (HSP70)